MEQREDLENKNSIMGLGLHWLFNYIAYNRGMHVAYLNQLYTFHNEDGSLGELHRILWCKSRASQNASIVIGMYLVQSSSGYKWIFWFQSQYEITKHYYIL